MVKTNFFALVVSILLTAFCSSAEPIIILNEDGNNFSAVDGETVESIPIDGWALGIGTSTNSFAVLSSKLLQGYTPSSIRELPFEERKDFIGFTLDLYRTGALSSPVLEVDLEYRFNSTKALVDNVILIDEESGYIFLVADESSTGEKNVLCSVNIQTGAVDHVVIPSDQIKNPYKLLNISGELILCSTEGTVVCRYDPTSQTFSQILNAHSTIYPPGLSSTYNQSSIRDYSVSRRRVYPDRVIYLAGVGLIWTDQYMEYAYLTMPTELLSRPRITLRSLDDPVSDVQRVNISGKDLILCTLANSQYEFNKMLLLDPITQSIELMVDVPFVAHAVVASKTDSIAVMIDKDNDRIVKYDFAIEEFTTIGELPPQSSDVILPTF